MPIRSILKFRYVYVLNDPLLYAICLVSKQLCGPKILVENDHFTKICCLRDVLATCFRLLLDGPLPLYIIIYVCSKARRAYGASGTGQ
jgi:hypothetical protein